MNTLKLILLSFILLFYNVVFAQKKFHAIITIPAELDSKKLQFFYHNGKEKIEIHPLFKGNTTIISYPFYSKFATIQCMYPQIKYTDVSVFFGNSFFVSDIPATITIEGNKGDTTKSPIENCKLFNAYEVEEIEAAKRLRLFCLKETNDYRNFLKEKKDEVYTNDSLLKISNVKYYTLKNKQIEFIKQNGHEYYSLWLFRSQLMNDFNDSNADSLLYIFNTAFPDSFKLSMEGTEIKKELEGRVYTKKNMQAPDFTTKDITGKIIKLNNYKGKYVLLSFWATWCGPCIQEIPFIKELRNKYPTKQLEIISVTKDTDKTAFLKAVKQYKMHWTNIFGDKELIKNYGSKPLPDLYLIDDTGKIIFYNWEDSLDELTLLLDKFVAKKIK